MEKEYFCRKREKKKKLREIWKKKISKIWYLIRYERRKKKKSKMVLNLCFRRLNKWSNFPTKENFREEERKIQF